MENSKTYYSHYPYGEPIGIVFELDLWCGFIWCDRRLRSIPSRCVCIEIVLINQRTPHKTTLDISCSAINKCYLGWWAILCLILDCTFSWSYNNTLFIVRFPCSFNRIAVNVLWVRSCTLNHSRGSKTDLRICLRNPSSFSTFCRRRIHSSQPKIYPH